MNSQTEVITIEFTTPDGKVWSDVVVLHHKPPDPRYAVADGGSPLWAAKEALVKKAMKAYLSTISQECIETSRIFLPNE